MRALLLLATLVTVGCSKTEEKPAKGDKAVDQTSKKDESKAKNDDLTDEQQCKRLAKIAQEGEKFSDDKLARVTKECIESMAEAPPDRKKCTVTCLADNDTLSKFEKCESACLAKLKKPASSPSQ